MYAIDIETSCKGKAEFRYWREGFKIDSLAVTWRGEDGALQSWFAADPTQIDRMIRRLAETQKPLVVHNLAFEMGVFMRLYPDLTFNWVGDTMRLAQLRDNGGDWRDTLKTADDLMDELLGEGDEDNKPKWKQKTGLGLEAVAGRFLPEVNHGHKQEAHKWLEENHGVKTKHGQHLHLLPYEKLRQYNIADTETTLLLFEVLDAELKSLEFDWSQDWILYTTRCRLMQQAYIKGLKIDREALKDAIYKTDAEIKAILADFFAATKDSRILWARANPGKLKRSPKQPDDFNIGSGVQLKQLFQGVLRLSTGKLTKTGQEKVDKKQLSAEQAAIQYPSFASKHLKLLGPLGEILYKRRKRLLVLQQMLACYMGSEEDGRLHAEVRVAGTRTNRVTGSSGGMG